MQSSYLSTGMFHVEHFENVFVVFHVEHFEPARMFHVERFEEARYSLAPIPEGRNQIDLLLISHIVVVAGLNSLTGIRKLLGFLRCVPTFYLVGAWLLSPLVRTGHDSRRPIARTRIDEWGIGVGGVHVNPGVRSRAAASWGSLIRRARRPLGATRLAAIGRVMSKCSTARRVTVSAGGFG